MKLVSAYWAATLFMISATFAQADDHTAECKQAVEQFKGDLAGGRVLNRNPPTESMELPSRLLWGHLLRYDALKVVEIKYIGGASKQWRMIACHGAFVLEGVARSIVGTFAVELTDAGVVSSWRSDR